MGTPDGDRWTGSCALRHRLNLHYLGRTLRNLLGAEAQTDTVLEEHGHAVHVRFGGPDEPTHRDAWLWLDAHHEYAAGDSVLVGEQQGGRALNDEQGVTGHEHDAAPVRTHQRAAVWRRSLVARKPATAPDRPRNVASLELDPDAVAHFR